MGADSISSDALLLLLETVNKQAAQIKRLEAIVSGDAFGACDTHSTHRHGGSDRDNKNSSSHQHNHKQLQQLQFSLQSLEQQQNASSTASKALADQLHKMEQRMQQLEVQGRTLQQQGQQLQQQLGSPAAPSRGSLQQQQQHRAAGTAYLSLLQPGSGEDNVSGSSPGLTHAGGPGSRSMAARLNKLEQRVEALAATAGSSEGKLQSASSAVHALEDDVSKQLHNIRADVQQAITVANSSLRADIEAAAQARQQADAVQLKQQLKDLAAELDGLVATGQRNLVVNLTAELERRTAAAQEAAESRIAALRAQVDRLEEEKADVTLVTQYTGQVADVFEQLATTVADSTQASIAQLMTQQQELRTLVTNLSASKADSSNLLQHQQHCQQQLLELQRGLAAAQTAASEAAVVAAVAKTALEPMDGLRLQLAETQGTVSALQATAASLETATNSTCSEQHHQAQQMQQLASSQHMLQQQLMALTNHVDPAAAAQLAAAAAGDESALNYQPLGPLAGGSASLLPNPVFEGMEGLGPWDEAYATGSYLQAVSNAGGHTQSQAGEQPASQSGTATAHAAAAGSQPGGGSGQLRPLAAGSAVGGAFSIGSSANGDSTPGTRTAAAGRGFADRMSSVLRHLPVAVRLMRLEAAVRDLSAAVARKAPAGDVQGLQQQLESISERLIAGLAQLEDVSSTSMRRLDQQAETLVDAMAALSDSVQERPTHAQVQDQLTGLTTEVDAVKARLRGAGQELQHLKDWQVQADKQVKALQGAEAQVRQLGQQLQDRVAADLSRQQQEVQQQLTRHSAEVARDTIKQIKADQEAMQDSAEAQARVLSLESKLKVVVAEVDRIQEQAALTARLQDKHTDMMAALEAALSAQSSKYATVSQHLRLELKEALIKAQQAHTAKVESLEAALQQQTDTLSELATAAAELPGKGGLLEAALKGAKVSMEELLSQHKKREEGRWEVWLAEFARAIEQRPTAAQLQKQLQAAQQAAESSAQDAAAQRIQCVTAALEANLRQQLRTVVQQIEQLRSRTQTLEQGTGIGEASFSDSPPCTPPHSQGWLGFGSVQGDGNAPDPTAAAAAGSSASAAACVDTAAGAASASEAPRVNVAAIVAAFEGSPPPPVHTEGYPVYEGASGGAGSTAAYATSPTSATAAGAAAEAARAAAAEAARASFADAQSSCRGDTSPAGGGRQWRLLPVPSSVLAEATGAAAAAAAASAHSVDSSVAARDDSGGGGGGYRGTSSGSATTVEVSSIGSSHGAHSSTAAHNSISAAAASDAAAAVSTAAAAPAHAHAGHAAGRSMVSFVEDWCVPGSDRAAVASGGSPYWGHPQQQQSVGALGAATQASAAWGMSDAASPSVTSLSPEQLVVMTGFTPGSSSCATSRPQHAAPAAAPAATMQLAPLMAAGQQPGALQAYSPGLLAAPPGSSSSCSTTPQRGILDGQQLQQLARQQVSPMRPLSATDTTDCTSELQQLLDLQQQVQRCLLDSGCVAVGRRAKPPRDRHGRKGHKRTWLNAKDSSSTQQEAGLQQQQQQQAPAEDASAAAGAAGGEVRTSQQIAAARPGQQPSGVEAAIAAAAAAMAEQSQGAEQAHSHAIAATGAAGHDKGAETSQQQQQQQQQHGEQSVQVPALPAPPLQQSAAGARKPSRSQEIRSLLTLQQQLADCLKEHGCTLQQQRRQQQQQQQQQAPPPAAVHPPSMAAAGLPQQQQQQQQPGSLIWPPPPVQQQQHQLQELPQQPHPQGQQQYSLQEAKLERLLMLQAQMQQMARQQEP